MPRLHARPRPSPRSALSPCAGPHLTDVACGQSCAQSCFDVGKAVDFGVTLATETLTRCATSAAPATRSIWTRRMLNARFFFCANAAASPVCLSAAGSVVCPVISVPEGQMLVFVCSPPLSISVLRFALRTPACRVSHAALQKQFCARQFQPPTQTVASASVRYLCIGSRLSCTVVKGLFCSVILHIFVFCFCQQGSF